MTPDSDNSSGNAKEPCTPNQTPSSLNSGRQEIPPHADLSKREGNEIQASRSMKTKGESSDIRSQGITDQDGNKPPKGISGDEQIKWKVRKLLEHKQTTSSPVAEHKVLATLGQLFYTRFTHFGDIIDLNKAIDYKSQAKMLLLDDHTDMPALLSGLGTLHRYRFERLGDPADIEQAISYQIQATVLTPADHENLASWLCDLGTSYWSRSLQFGGIADIHSAIERHTQAVALAPDGHANKPVMMNNLGAAYQSRFDYLGNLQDITDAINCKAKAVSLAPEDHPSLPTWLSNLGNSYLLRYEHLAEPSDIETAIRHQGQAVSLTPSDHPEMPFRLSNLGISYQLRFKHLGELADINCAIDYISRALSLGPDGHVGVPAWLSNLGSCYQSRFGRTGMLDDVNEAISLSSKAVSLTPDGHVSMATYLTNLGGSHARRYEHVGELEDIEEAVKYYSRAISVTDDGNPSKPARLSGLGSAYCCRFERLGNLVDINNAIDCQSTAVMLTPEGHADMPTWLSNLGDSYSHRFGHLGEREDIEKAIAQHTRAIALAPDGHPERPEWLVQLGTSYYRRFEHLGDIADIDSSIEWMQQAVSVAADDHTRMPRWLDNLGNSYDSRFERLEEIADIDKSIDLRKQALELTPDGHSLRPGFLTNLAVSYQQRFRRLGEVSDANNAILLGSEALALVPNDHEHKRAILNNLGSSYLRRFERTGELSDCGTGIDLFGQAIASTPNDHADRPDLLSNMGRAHKMRFERQGELVDLDQAIDYHEQAISLAPDGYARTPAWSRELGDYYFMRASRLRRSQDLIKATNYLKQAAESNIGGPIERFVASHSHAWLSMTFNVSPPLLAYQRAMELVPQLVWLGSTVNRRFSDLAIVGTTSLEAASCAISLKSYDNALEWLEEGHSIIWNQILQLRTSFEDLRAANPSIAGRMTQVGRELEHAGYRSNVTYTLTRIHSAPDLDEESRRHRRLAAEWNQLLETAREIPGFGDFLRARKAGALMRTAKDGPVIMVNVHERRCDALIIRPNDENIAHVPLENFSPDKAVNARAKLASYIGHRGGRARGLKLAKPAPKPEESFKGMLAALWRDVVKPVLDFLGYTQKLPAEALPHVTWCTTGTLSFLPLHAAGCYDGSNCNAVDLVVSSYTPTLSALLTPSSPDSTLNSGVLAIGQQYTQGLGELPNTVPELEAVKESAKSTQYLQLDGANATVNAVLDAMDKYSWVHLACHASQDPTDPAQSSFHLHDGGLPLSAIVRRSFKNKGLAFLSACQTAMGDEKLPDEAVHLAGGMLMAGYPSVIATMWGINDVDAPEVARHVYADLLKDGRLDYTGASRALHKAVAVLREMVGENSFERWVPFVHMGS